MGTKGVFAVATDKPGGYYATILGATHDGNRDGLKYLGHLFAEVTRGLQSVTQVSKRNSGTFPKQIFGSHSAMVRLE